MGLQQTLQFINNHTLAQKHKLRAYTRFFKWQVSQAIKKRPVVYPFIGTTSLCVQKGMAGATGNIYCGLHDFEDMGFLLHFLRPGDLFIDIGANVGSYSILASGVTGATTISIEPVLQTFGILKENIRINNLAEKVTALNIGIGAKKGILSFTQNFDTVNHVIIDKPGKENGGETTMVQVPVETIDHLLVDKKTPLLLKIDVEGFEQEVINGAAGVLGDENLKAIIIELNGCGLRYGFEDVNIHEQLKSYGFSSYLYTPFERELQIAEGFGKFNTIYLRDIDFVQKRLKTAESFIALSEKI